MQLFQFYHLDNIVNLTQSYPVLLFSLVVCRLDLSAAATFAEGKQQAAMVYRAVHVPSGGAAILQFRSV